MKTQSSFRFVLAIAVSSMTAISFTSADIIYWDGTSDTWNSVTNWTTADGADTPDPLAVPGSLDDTIFNRTGQNGNIFISLDANQAANSFTFTSTGTTAFRGNTSGTTARDLTIGSGGITLNNGAGATTFGASNTGIINMILSANQTWTNNSDNALNVGTTLTGVTNANINNGGFQLTIDGSGNTNIGVVNNAAAVLSGGGALVKNGTGLLTLGGDNSAGFSGNVTVNNGILNYGDRSAALGTGNLKITNGIIESRWQSGITRTQGIGAGEIQITGGVSGFSANGNSSTFNVGAVTWGDATFNPTEFVLQSENATNGNGTFSSSINLNGADRTIRSDQAANTTGSGIFSGVISNSTGTAGLIKVGVGHHILSNAANSYNGATTVNAGTLTARVLANGGANSSIGSSSNAAANLLIGNGATFRYDGNGHSTNRGFTINGTADGHGAALDASGSGAVNWTNTDSPAYGTANQTRTLTLTGTNTGNNTLAANITDNGSGAVSLNKTGAGLWVLSGNNSYTGTTTLTDGTLSVSSASNLGSSSSNFVINGGTLQITGTALTNFASLGRTVSFASGANVSLDISDANNVFALDRSFNLGTGSLTKAGAGTLRFDDGISLSVGSLVLNGGTFAVNRSTNTTLGTELPALIGGAGGAISNIGAGTVILNSALAIQTVALDTSGGGTFSLTGVTTPTFGGLSGATGDLATVISSGYASVTALTLNPQSGSTFTYGGVISDGAAGMTLTKTGAGTQILTGANTYTGATIVNDGTLEIGTGGSISSASTLRLGGGTLAFNNTSAGQTLNGLTVGAGNSAVSNLAASQTLTLGAITRSAGIYGTVNFTNLTGSISTTTGNTNGIIGAWATTGSTTTLSYAVGSPDGSTPTDISALTGTTATAGTLANVTDATDNFEYSAAATTSANLTANTLRYSGGGTTTTIGATNTLTLNGFMNAGSNNLTISGGPTTGGILIGSSGELVIIANNRNTTINAAIAGTGRLVYSSSEGGTLTLTNNNNAYTGGTVLNSGRVAIGADARLGEASGGITFNGGELYISGDFASARTVTLNQASGSRVLLQGNADWINTGALTGDGGITFRQNPNGGVSATFDSMSNDFKGHLGIESSNGGAITVRLNSLADSSAANGNIIFGAVSATQNQTFEWRNTAGSALTLDNRRLEFSGNGDAIATVKNSNTTNAITINTDLVNTGTGAKTLILDAAAGPTNVFGGIISDGAGGGTVALTKSGANSSTWRLSGSNTFSGSTRVSGGILELNNSLALQNSPLDATNSANGNSATGLRALVTTLTIGGLDGTKNLSTLFTTTSGGYTSLTGLTLNPGIGVTHTYTGAIADGAAGMTLTKTGTGTQILSGTNSYTGATTVSAGSLIVNGSIATSSLTTVASGATISGSGTIGALTVSSGGFINPGNSPDILTVVGDYTQAGLYTAEITGLTAGVTGHDQIGITGAVDITGGSLTALFSAGSYTANDLIFILLNDGTDAITGTYAGLADGATVTNYGGYDWTISYFADSGTGLSTGGNDIALLAAAPIPEPHTALLSCLGVLLLLRRRR